MRLAGRRNRAGCVVAVGVMLLALATLAVLGVLLYRQSRLLSAEAPAQSVRASQTTWYDPDSDRRVSGYDVQYVFTVEHRTYRDTDAHDRSYDPSARYKVCYNPNDPSQHTLVRAERKCGRGL